MRFIKRPAPSPSFDRGWRLGVAFGAAIVLSALLAALLSITGAFLG